MTVVSAVRPIPSGIAQWWVLTRRLIAPTLRNGEVAVGVAVSVAVTASLYIPLNRLMDGFGTDDGSRPFRQNLRNMCVAMDGEWVVPLRAFSRLRRQARKTPARATPLRVRAPPACP